MSLRERLLLRAEWSTSMEVSLQATNVNCTPNALDTAFLYHAIYVQRLLFLLNMVLYLSLIMMKCGKHLL